MLASHHPKSYRACCQVQDPASPELRTSRGNLVLWRVKLQRWVGRSLEPQFLFPFIAAVLLAVVWSTTFSLIRNERANAERAAAVSSRELLGTYEAQVVRALREIRQTLNLVKFWHEQNAGQRRLAELAASDLLPPNLVFVVSIADANGLVLDSTGQLVGNRIDTQDYFQEQLAGEQELSIGRLPPGPTGDAQLPFSVRLVTPTGEFNGVVVVAVNAGYFVSGYETSHLGQHGVLGIFGLDGVFRVRRTGDAVHSGDPVDYASMVPAEEDLDADATLSTSSWDGVPRWTSTRELFGFPLAVVAGLAADEVLVKVREDSRTYVWRALFGSLFVVFLTAILGYMSWQIARGRKREGEAKLAHAQRVEYLAYHDGLTGLPNRSLFSKLLTQSISDSQDHSRQLAVAFLDLDRFKQINDTLGHEAGDQLLKEVAVRLKDCVREGDTVARLGGDEFVVILPDLGDGHAAAVVAEKILTLIARPFTLIGEEFRVTASIGISIFPQDGLDEQTLTKNADIAMYQAKADGKNNFQFYSDKLNANTLERLALESSLRHALERNEFQLHYQARRDIVSGRITGMEALLRWEHPDFGTVAPMRFIPVAEETGIIVPIGKWVLKSACQQNMEWQRQGMHGLSIAVNLTPRQFHDEHLLQDVASILQSTGMEPGLLELEINERLLTHDVDRTLKILTGLKGMGVRIAVDDFGTGYSSLATLQRFPLDTIKIDRSLIRDVVASNEDMGLADAIIAMGKSLAVTVVAQGVETKEQAQFLRAHACDELQGFYFNRPLPAGQSTDLLLAQSSGITYTGKRLILKED
jgi:diguanylate cyclase (GGDEF)-like protein